MDNEKILGGGRLLWCGARVIFTTSWTRGLLLLGSDAPDLHYYTD